MDKPLHPDSVAAGSALRIRYFDREGTFRTAVLLSTEPIEQVREEANEIRQAMHNFIEARGGIVLDIAADIEDREQIMPIGSTLRPTVRGAGFLQLATIHGRTVSGRETVGIDLILSDQDDLWQPTDLGELGSTYG